jgi:hypothetical protein
LGTKLTVDAAAVKASQQQLFSKILALSKVHTLLMEQSDVVGVAKLLRSSLVDDTTLQTLDLQRYTLSEQDLFEVSWLADSHSSLRTLNLENQTYTGFSARALAKTMKKNTTLTELRLISLQSVPSDVTGALLGGLRKATSLVSVSLSWIHDDILPGLIDCLNARSLKYLTCGGAHDRAWSDEHAVALFDALSSCRLVSLRVVPGLVCEASDVVERSFLKCIRQNTTLTSLECSTLA